MNPQTLTLKEFLATHKISRATYYRLRASGEAPRTVRVGRRVLIAVTDAREWLERLQSEASPQE